MKMIDQVTNKKNQPVKQMLNRTITMTLINGRRTLISDSATIILRGIHIGLWIIARTRHIGITGHLGIPGIIRGMVIIRIMAVMVIGILIIIMDGEIFTLLVML